MTKALIPDDAGMAGQKPATRIANSGTDAEISELILHSQFTAAQPAAGV